MMCDVREIERCALHRAMDARRDGLSTVVARGRRGRFEKASARARLGVSASSLGLADVIDEIAIARGVAL